MRWIYWGGDLGQRTHEGGSKDSMMTEVRTPAYSGLPVS